MRSCDGCTKCCEGWLTGTINGKYMYPGKPCHYVSKCNGCTIYENRPKEPCKDFICDWKSDLEFPAWLKPSEADVIFQTKIIPNTNISYINVTEAGSKLSVEVLSWAFMELFLKRRKNLVYRINGGVSFVGTNEFVDEYTKFSSK